MLSRWRWRLIQISRRLWVRASLIGLLGILAAMLAAVAESYLPWQVPGSIAASAVNEILNILASSMLAVTTFSLSVMTSAYSAATSNVTPRATALLMQDRVTQNVLATFIGSFLFALVGIVMLKTGIYGDKGRVILFVATIAVIALIVATLIRWIDHLSRLGRVSETTNRVEAATLDAIEARLQAPFLGGERLAQETAGRQDGTSVYAQATGYIRHIDTQGLSDCAEQLEAELYLDVLPGTFVHPARALLKIAGTGEVSDEMLDRVRARFDVDSERSFDQDPRFGFAVLSEIAIRALSPAVNDSGTAIDVIGRQTRLLVRWAKGCARDDADEVTCPRVHVPPIEVADLFDDAFNLIARDGSTMIEVQLRLQKALHALAQVGDDAFRRCARQQARLATERAIEAMTALQDKERLREAAAWSR